MPKVKNSPIKNSKKTISSKRFSLSRLQVLLILLVVAVLGVLVVYKSDAASSAVHSYNWNTAGIAHTVGNAGVLGSGGTPCSTSGCGAQFWAANSTTTAGGHYMWFGPYYDLPGNNHTLQVCWYYIAGTSKAASIDFNFSYNNGVNVLYDSGSKAIPPNGLLSGLLVQQQFCVNKQLGAGPYPNFEMRVKPLSVGSPSVSGWDNNSFKVLKTTWQFLN